MNNIAINNTIQTFTESRKTTTKATGSSDFGIALQSAFSYSEARGVNAISSNALEMLDDELEDMYVVSEAHKLQMPMAQRSQLSPNEYKRAHTEIREERKEILGSQRCIDIIIDEGKLTDFIEEIQNGLENGKSLYEVLQDHSEKYKEADDLNGKEIFYIDPNTGSVEYVQTKNRCIHISPKQMDMDALTSYAIADDIATVLRYTYFREDTDDPVKIKTLISAIGERSAGYNTDRFDSLWDTTVEHSREWIAMMHEKYWDEDSTEYDDMVDSLLELLDRHFKAEQKRDAENDDFGNSSLTVAAMAAKIAVSKTNDTSTLAV